MKRMFIALSIAGSMMMATPCFAAVVNADVNGTWVQEAGIWKWKNPNGTYAANTWAWLDGNKDGVSEGYYFDESGNMLSNTTTPDLFTVNENGALTVNGVVQTKVDTVTSKNTQLTNSLLNADGTVNYNAVRARIMANKYFQATDEETARTMAVDLVNQIRAYYGLSKLTADPSLMAFAQVRANECKQMGVYGHVRPDGTTVGKAENAGMSHTAGVSVFGFYSSARHRENMLNPNITKIGIGFAGGEFWIQDFE